jgi:hypothetical protein
VSPRGLQDQRVRRDEGVGASGRVPEVSDLGVQVRGHGGVEGADGGVAFGLPGLGRAGFSRRRRRRAGCRLAARWSRVDNPKAFCRRRPTEKVTHCATGAWTASYRLAA